MDPSIVDHDAHSTLAVRCMTLRAVGCTSLRIGWSRTATIDGGIDEPAKDDDEADLQESESAMVDWVGVGARARCKNESNYEKGRACLCVANKPLRSIKSNLHAHQCLTERYRICSSPPITDGCNQHASRQRLSIHHHLDNQQVQEMQMRVAKSL
jgi:hypothetical protein